MSESNRRPSMRAIATAAGVSVITVSRVLRGEAHVSTATRDRVTAEAARQGYQLSPLVSTVMANLRRQEGRVAGEVLALVTQFADEAGWQSLGNAKAARAGARNRAHDLGFRLEEFHLGSDRHAHERLAQILHTRGIRGVLLGPFRDPSVEVHLDFSRIACATVSYNPDHLATDRSCPDFFEGTRRLWMEVHRRGYRRIALALTARFDTYSHHRALGAFLSIAGHLPETPPPFIAEQWTLGEFWRWFDAHRPDAILCQSDRIWEWLQDKGVDVPGEVALANLELEGWSGFPMAGWHWRGEDIGAGAVDLVAGRLLRGSYGLPEHPRIVSMAGHFRAGPTLPDVAPTRRRITRSRGDRDGLFRGLTTLIRKAAVPLSLQGIADVALETPSKLPDPTRPALVLESQTLEVGGVPFTLASHPHAAGAAGVLLRDSRAPNDARGRPPRPFRLETRRRVEHLVFLHVCGYARSRASVATYQFHYGDGTVVEWPVIVHHRPDTDGEAHPDVPESNVQDWWPSYPRPSAPEVRPLRLRSQLTWEDTDARFAYASAWHNPHPEKVLSELRALPSGDGADVLLLLAVTALGT